MLRQVGGQSRFRGAGCLELPGLALPRHVIESSWFVTLLSSPATQCYRKLMIGYSPFVLLRCRQRPAAHVSWRPPAASHLHPLPSMVAYRGLTIETRRSAGLASGGGFLLPFKYTLLTPDHFLLPSTSLRISPMLNTISTNFVRCCLPWIRRFHSILTYHSTKNGRSSNLPSNVYTFTRSASYQN